jgi:ribonuclease III
MIVTADEIEHGRLSVVSAMVGHSFCTPSLLLTALTHRSYCNEHPEARAHNERLELLGDAVLSLVVVDHLLAAMPDATEGTVTEQRARRVSTVALAAAGRRSGLVDHLRVGRGMHNDHPPSIAADVVEAVIGAAYLDGGLAAARVVVARLLPDEHLPEAMPRTNAKRDLQERLQHLFGRAPTYSCERLGEATPTFAAVALFDDTPIGRGEGPSKKAATEAAAWQAWDLLRGLDDAALQARWTRARS